MLIQRMAQADLERLLVARELISETMRPLTLLFMKVGETDSFRRGLQATAANGDFVTSAATHARQAVAVLRPSAESGVSRDVTRAVNMLEGISWDRMDELFRSTTTSDPGDIIRYEFARQADVATHGAEYAVQKAARQAANDMIRAAG